MPGAEGKGRGGAVLAALGKSATEGTSDAEATTKRRKILQVQLPNATSPLPEPFRSRARVRVPCPASAVS